MSTDPTPRSTGAAAAASSDGEARLQASRAALRTAMLPRSPDAAADAGRPPSKTGLPARVGALLSHPVVETLRDTVRQWWYNHPWRPAITVGVEAGSRMMVPLARRHPGRLLAGAMVAGAVLSRVKPWKWIVASVAPSLLASMLPSLLSRIASRVPPSTLLRLVGGSSEPARAVPTAPRSTGAARSSPVAASPRPRP